MFCKNCGNNINNNDKFCGKCGMKQEIQNSQLNNGDSKSSDKLTKILGICAGISFGLSAVIIILGVILLFPDPSTGENLSGLSSFDLFGNLAGIMTIISVVLVILIVILNVIKSNKNKRS